MSRDTLTELLNRIDPAEVARVCADLVRLNTANPPGNERMAAEYVARYLGAAGFEVHFFEYPGEEGRASVACRLKGTGRGPATAGPAPALVFNGHLDVVPAGAQAWVRPAFGGEIANGEVWGRGTTDMKGGVAALMVATRAVAEARLELRGDLLFAGTAGEEAGMVGAQQFAAWPELGPLAAVIIAEPTANTLGLAERGVLWVALTTYGKTAHGSTPHLGRNAINAMRRLLDEFERLAIPFETHPILGDFTYSINTITGGAASNVVPDRCVANIDLRTVPGQSHAAILRQVQELIDRLSGAEPGFEASAAGFYDLPAAATPPDHPTVASFTAAAEKALGRPVHSAVVRFATEAAIFVPALGVPAIIFGPGDPGLAHQPDEHAPIAQMAEATRVYASAALAMLS